jgi:hypothetical protein
MRAGPFALNMAPLFMMHQAQTMCVRQALCIPAVSIVEYSCAF